MLRRSFVEEICDPTTGLWIVVQLSSARDFVFVAIETAIIRRPETFLDKGHRGPWGARVVRG
jgi:hypothetical protein